MQFAAACSPPATTTAAASTISCSFDALRCAKPTRPTSRRDGSGDGEKAGATHACLARCWRNAASRSYPYVGDRGNFTRLASMDRWFYTTPTAWQRQSCGEGGAWCFFKQATAQALETRIWRPTGAHIADTKVAIKIVAGPRLPDARSDAAQRRRDRATVVAGPGWQCLGM